MFLQIFYPERLLRVYKGYYYGWTVLNGHISHASAGPGKYCSVKNDTLQPSPNEKYHIVTQQPKSDRIYALKVTYKHTHCGEQKFLVVLTISSSLYQALI